MIYDDSSRKYFFFFFLYKKKKKKKKKKRGGEACASGFTNLTLQQKVQRIGDWRRSVHCQ